MLFRRSVCYVIYDTNKKYKSLKHETDKRYRIAPCIMDHASFFYFFGFRDSIFGFKKLCHRTLIVKTIRKMYTPLMDSTD